MKQSTWETWLVASLILFLSFLFTATLEGSRAIVELPYLLVVAGINLVRCIYIGYTTRVADDYQDVN